ncbi:DUF3293 domain-containing protein [Deinococcus metallilatus]|uniref:DUF3293 domain-containing protein n=1 Tax=Deinococcus metallilatus TaxID=1211322 RepID=A0AAJ5JWZ5_9DEIO|nr:DUF3293 domain-containing protein [Deinococcus metallilatus]MBB5297440.1 hypothetical protein [Deinococcus metallilatus]QBY08338.1 DUF3293 domain-containing protein [Deinococcus metallilatus]RXJ11441.1 DUF3293 domain-containing protein [Deinococcus metallilatus]TLK20612.1 DUF3293 domain-containing protein [Deinococcus metallilatus]GMA16997.1 hypothetical protein GCM10025871_33280 [Deinococcus metallilatus]
MKGDLRAAFLGTTYGTAHERFRLSAERGPAPAWARRTWAVVTAWNPGAVQLPHEINAQAEAALLARVRASGLSPLPAHNGEGEWREEALIVPGARLGQAAAWGGTFGQAAVLWGTGARAALVWLDGEGNVSGVERFWAGRVAGCGR